MKSPSFSTYIALASACAILSEASGLELGDWSGKDIILGDPSKPNGTEPCYADIPTRKVYCDLYFDGLEDMEFYSEMSDESCADFAGPINTTEPLKSGVVKKIHSDANLVTLAMDFPVYDASDKNQGTLHQLYCAQGEVFWVNCSDPQKDVCSMLTKKVQANITFNYDLTGQFIDNSGVDTTAFDATVENFDVSRSISLAAYLGKCGDEITDTDNFVVGASDTVSICAYMADDLDTDVMISGIKKIEFTNPAKSSEYPALFTPIVDGNEGFVTVLDPSINEDGVADTRSVSITTLIVPGIIDEFGGNAGVVKISGVALLTYNSPNRRLQTSQESFSLTIKTKAKAVPDIVEKEGSGAMRVGAGIIGFAAGVMALF